MAKYRRKPIIVEAVQWVSGMKHPKVKSDSYMCYLLDDSHFPDVYTGDYILTYSDRTVEVKTQEEMDRDWERVEEKTCPSCLGSKIDTLDPHGDLALCTICKGTGKVEE